MTTKEYWLTKLAEELGEAQKDVFKALTFGVHDREPGQLLSNLERLRNELIDVAAVIEILEKDCNIYIDTNAGEAFEKALKRKRKYYDVGKVLNIIID